MDPGYGTTSDTSGIYGTIAVIFIFQGFYAFAITPMTSAYPTEVSQYKLRAAGIAVFRFFDCGFGMMASFALGFAMQNLGWKFYLINAAIDVLFFVVAYFLFVETAGLTLEEINRKFEGTTVVVLQGGDRMEVAQPGPPVSEKERAVQQTSTEVL